MSSLCFIIILEAAHHLFFPLKSKARASTLANLLATGMEVNSRDQRNPWKVFCAKSKKLQAQGGFWLWPTGRGHGRFQRHLWRHSRLLTSHEWQANIAIFKGKAIPSEIYVAVLPPGSVLVDVSVGFGVRVHVCTHMQMCVVMSECKYTIYPLHLISLNLHI